MAMTAGPRDRHRSTVRLVSVVVPDWLIATTSVSDMSSRNRKPESSVAVIGVDGDAGSDQGVLEGRRDGLTGNRRGALADHVDPGQLAGRQPLGHGLGHGVGRQVHVEHAILFDKATPQGLAERRRRLADLLEQEVGGVAPIDVPGGDRRDLPFVGAERQRGAVVGDAGHPRSVAGQRTGEPDDLALAGGRVVGIGRGFAVHPEVHVGVLDNAIGLGGDDEAILGQADVHPLAAAPQCQVHVLGVDGGADPDGHRTFELGHRRSNGLVEIEPGGQAPADHRRDDLGIGCDLGCDRQPVGGDQVCEVVDVAVEGGGHVRSGLGPDLIGVDRVGIRFADDADGRPAGVGQHGDLGALGLQGPVEQLVRGDGLPHGRGVVSQFTDLGRRLVDEAEVPVDHSDRPVDEQRIGGPVGQQGGDGLGFEVESVASDQHVQPGRVTAPNLQPIEVAQGLLDAEGGGQAGPGEVRPAERRHFGGGPEPIALDRPQGVLQIDQGTIDGLEVPDLIALGLEMGLDRVDLVVDGGQHVGHGRHEPGRCEHGRQARFSPQQPIGGRQPLGDRGDGRCLSGSTGGRHLAERGSNLGQELVDVRGAAIGSSSDDGDDSTHVLLFPPRDVPTRWSCDNG